MDLCREQIMAGASRMIPVVSWTYQFNGSNPDSAKTFLTGWLFDVVKGCHCLLCAPGHLDAVTVCISEQSCPGGEVTWKAGVKEAASLFVANDRSCWPVASLHSSLGGTDFQFSKLSVSVYQQHGGLLWQVVVWHKLYKSQKEWV